MTTGKDDPGNNVATVELVATRLIAATAPPPPTLPRGTILGRYVILDVLGVGGQGEVYSAVDPELDRKVAIKLVKEAVDGEPGLASSGQTRLLREAQAMAKLSHPNVVQVFDVGVVDGRVFLAMEFVKGVTLKAWLKEKARGWGEVLRVMVDAGRGLAAAHLMGVVHRDFKPDNVLLGEDGRVRVLDFGLARANPADTGQALPVFPGGAAAEISGNGGHGIWDATLTQAGGAAGTPAYMAPEQMQGKDLDARTDQFSFCTTFYEALYGARPFPGRDLQSLMDAVSQGAVSPAPKGSRVPAWLRAVVVRGLNASPDERFPSLEALLQAAGRDPTVARRQRWSALAGVALVMGVGLGARELSQRQTQQCQGAQMKLQGVWDEAAQSIIHKAFIATQLPYAPDAWRTLKSGLDAYAQGWVAQHKQVCESTWLTGEQSQEVMGLRMQCLTDRLEDFRVLGATLAKADAATVERAASAPGALTQLDRCADVPLLQKRMPLPKNDGVVKEVEEVQRKLAQARALKQTGHYPQGLAVAQAAAAQALETEYPPAIAESLALRTKMELLQEQFAACRESAFLTIGWSEVSGDDALRFEAIVDMMHAAAFAGLNYEEHLGYARLAEKILLRLKDPAPHQQNLYHARGNLSYFNGKPKEALEAYQQGLVIAQARHAPETNALMTNVAAMLGQLGKVKESLEASLAALKVDQATLGAQHPDVAISLQNVGAAYLDLRQHAKAVEYTSQALEMTQALFGPVHTRTAQLQMALGSAYKEMGHWEHAETLGRLALKTLMVEAPHGPVTANAYLILGNTLVARGSAAEGLTFIQESLDRSVSMPQGVRAQGMADKGTALAKLHRLKDAQTAFEIALQYFASDPDHDVSQEAQARFELAKVRWHLGGNKNAAWTLAEKALAGVKGDPTGFPEDQLPIQAWLNSHPTVK